MSKSATVQVHLLDGGSLSTADISILHANEPSNSFRMYDWCFHVFHASSNRHILWDVGITSDYSLYTPLVNKVQLPSANPVGPRASLEDQLEALGTKADAIDTVIFSHAHWDHCRPIRSEFPKAKGIFGPGTAEHCGPGHIQNGAATDSSLWDGRFFGNTSTEDWSELQGHWQPFGPFPRAIDYFGDGSFMIIDAPGHMPGNLAAAARIDSGQGTKEWVILASDCCHSRALLDGSKEFALFDTPDGKACLHSDISAAKRTIGALNQAERDGMHIAMAHDAEWMLDGTDEVLLSLIPPSVRSALLRAVSNGEAP